MMFLGKETVKQAIESALEWNFIPENLEKIVATLYRVGAVTLYAEIEDIKHTKIEQDNIELDVLAVVTKEKNYYYIIWEDEQGNTTVAKLTARILFKPESIAEVIRALFEGKPDPLQVFPLLKSELVVIKFADENNITTISFTGKLAFYDTGESSNLIAVFDKLSATLEYVREVRPVMITLAKGNKSEIARLLRLAVEDYGFSDILVITRRREVREVINALSETFKSSFSLTSPYEVVSGSLRLVYKEAKEINGVLLFTSEPLVTLSEPVRVRDVEIIPLSFTEYCLVRTAEEKDYVVYRLAKLEVKVV